MSRRDRILAMALGAIVVAFALYMALGGLLLSPARELQSRVADLTRANAQKATDKSFYEAQVARLSELAGESFCGDADRASEQVRARLAELLQRSKLSISLKPMGGPTVRGAYKEIAWLISSAGRLDRVIDFLYLLNAEPYLHRVENLSLTPTGRSGEVDVKLRFATIVLLGEKGQTPAGRELPAAGQTGDLAGVDRGLYEVIASRDLFRPYVKVKPPKTPQRKRSKAKPKNGPKKRQEDPAGIYVVSLTSWAGQQEVTVHDKRKKQVRTYKPGESLDGGKIVMVDYRKIPVSDKAAILSGSRVILKIDNQYWAVELGQNLAQKRRLTEAQLPSELKPTPRPADPALGGKDPQVSLSGVLVAIAH